MRFSIAAAMATYRGNLADLERVQFARGIIADGQTAVRAARPRYLEEVRQVRLILSYDN